MVKNKILNKLRDRKSYFSGQDLSKELGISRTAIWKHICSLRKDGYVIDASPRKGYLLKKIPDLLLPQELERALKNKKIGKRVIHFQTVESTIDIAKGLDKRSDGDGTVVVAEKQTAGKGRFGRSWVSPKGGIWLSTILHPVLDPLEAPKLNIVGSMSIVHVIRDLGLEPKVKWPNDVIVNGKKIAGVLIHMNAELDKINYLILSMGINANNNLKSLPEKVAKNVTTIRKELGKKIRRIDFAVDLLTELEKNYSKIFDNHFDSLLNEWKKLCITINKEVAVESVNGRLKGIAKDVDQYGRLILYTKDEGKKLISSGEATILK